MLPTSSSTLPNSDASEANKTGHIQFGNTIQVFPDGYDIRVAVDAPDKCFVRLIFHWL